MEFQESTANDVTFVLSEHLLVEASLAVTQMEFQACGLLGLGSQVESYVTPIGPCTGFLCS